jgi:hypothetical protein
MSRKIHLAAIGTILLTLFTGCSQNDTPNNDPGKSIEANVVTVAEGNYIGSEYKGNYIYAGAMNLAWNELNENVLKEKLQLKTPNQDALATLQKLNNPTFKKTDLDEASYYMKSGYGQKTVDAINTEVKTKFPSKTFADLDLKLSENDIIAYAYLFKQVEYFNPFKEDKVFFAANFDADFKPNPKYENAAMEPFIFSEVKGFKAEEANQKENIRIIHYWNDDKFIISVKLKNDADEIFLAKGFDMKTPDELVEEIKEAYQNKLPPEFSRLAVTEDFEPMAAADIFQMPYLNFEYKRIYKEMIGQQLANKGFESHIIAQMFENIKFKMDYKGAKVENEAVVVTTETAHYVEPVKNKQFILDKPFWVVMKRKSSSNPYFILGVKNTEFMEKIEK